MKMGAFEYTPPRGGSRPSSQEQQGGLEEEDSAASVSPPEFSTVKVAPPSSGKRRSVAHPPSGAPAMQSPKKAEQGSARKRKRSPSPVYPKTHYPTGDTSSFPSPAKYSSIRRKYSTADYSTPTRKRSRSETQPTPAKAPQQDGSFEDDDEPLTPEFDMASPLLRTQLKAMTPNTPLSNRLVGASLDIGSISQESRLQDYDDSFNSGEPAPPFELATLPAAFQVQNATVIVCTFIVAAGDANADCLVLLLPERNRCRADLDALQQVPGRR